MAQLEPIEAIEKRLWSAADTLRANSNYASNEYFLPVMPQGQLRDVEGLVRRVNRAEIAANVFRAYPTLPSPLYEMQAA